MQHPIQTLTEVPRGTERVQKDSRGGSPSLATGSSRTSEPMCQCPLCCPPFQHVLYLFWNGFSPLQVWERGCLPSLLILWLVHTFPNHMLEHWTVPFCFNFNRQVTDHAEDCANAFPSPRLRSPVLTPESQVRSILDM